MALAQEQFGDPLEDDGVASTASPDEPPESGRSRAGRVRDPQETEGKLARAVDELKGSEDSMRATLAEVQRVLHRIEARRVHEDAGYATCAEFEERMLAWAPLVRVMRAVAGRSTTACPQLAEERRDPAEDRARSVKALTAIAHALTRLRSLEAEMHESALKARGTLERVESGRLFEECGYASYEEFLERAVGPSPLLGCALASLAVEASHETHEAHEQVSEDELIADGGDELPAALALHDLQLQTGEPDPTPLLAGPPAASGEPERQPTGGGSLPRMMVLSIVAAVVCAAAGLGGAYAAVSLIGPQAEPPAEAGAPVSESQPVAAAPATRAATAPPATRAATAPPATRAAATTPRGAVTVRSAREIHDTLDKGL
ncbi:MAG: hypothetical protein ABTD50_15055 [Polyangiaceae bacterium]